MGIFPMTLMEPGFHPTALPTHVILSCTYQNLEGFLLRVPAFEILGVESKLLSLYFIINVSILQGCKEKFKIMTLDYLQSRSLSKYYCFLL